MKKVTLEFEDGTVKTIEGDMAKLWDSFCRNAATMLSIRKQNPAWELIEWKISQKKNEEIHY